MNFWNRRIARLIAIGALLPLLLLAFLWRKEWIANHPPLSRSDSLLLQSFEKADFLTLSGQPGDLAPPGDWQKDQIGIEAGKQVVVRDRARMLEIHQVLHSLDNRKRDAFQGGATNFMLLRFYWKGARTDRAPWPLYQYWRDGEIGYLVPISLKEAPSRTWYTTYHLDAAPVPLRFARRFEAIVADLAHRAEVGEPGLSLENQKTDW